jgi:transcriptional regulator with XRE-family HTH domain
MRQTKRETSPTMTRFKETFGRNLKLWRTASGMTGEEFCRHLGLSRSHLYLIEMGKAGSLGFSALYRIKEAMDMNTFFNKEITDEIIKDRDEV